MLHWSWCAGHETNAVPAGASLPERSPRRASCAVFGNVFDPASTSFITGTDTAIDLYIENTTYYHNWAGGDHHLQTKINGQFAQINLDGPDGNLRGTNAPAHETTFNFQFKRRDTGQPVSIPWMQFTFFDLDEIVLNEWLVSNGATTGHGREARAHHPTPPHPTPLPCGNRIAPNRSALTPSPRRVRLAVRYSVGIHRLRALRGLHGERDRTGQQRRRRQHRRAPSPQAPSPHSAPPLPHGVCPASARPCVRRQVLLVGARSRRGQPD